MGTATQNHGGPLLGTNISPGMSYNAGTGAWAFFGSVSMGGAWSVNPSGANGIFVNLLNAGASGDEFIRWTRSGVSRCQITGHNTSEAGSDSGSNWAVSFFTDAGAFIDIPFAMERIAGGVISFGGSTRRTLATTGGRVKAVDVVTDTVTLNATHHVVVCNKGTAMTVNLPAVASNAGREYIIKNKGAGMVTVDANASELIDNATTTMLAQWQIKRLVCDGTIWMIV